MRALLVLAMLALLPGAPATVTQTVEGAEIHWSSKGDGPKTVIFVHGWTCDETAWSGQVPAISRSHRVITLDLPGHGRSGMPADGEVSIERFARAVEARPCRGIHLNSPARKDQVGDSACEHSGRIRRAAGVAC